MRRRALIVLLAIGTLAGYSSGFASLYRWHRYGHGRGHGWSCHHHGHSQAQAPVTGTPGEPGPR
ncbi:hypothetical protein [Archangium lipolyticum]|uniref:hypothetical protein n=1 Tax=Archangium lipolyticum TaxID=2970465 RepID=UPI002149B0C8|nr:hypothetical protein [Archangium lipolyticum]